jgi:tRNA (guanine37-N1)-methyltransferase
VTLRIDVLTLFPAMFEGPLETSIPGRAIANGIVEVAVHDLREHGLGRHRTVDDSTYGGGAGMVMRPEPVVAAIEAVRRPGSVAVLLDPAGERFDQARARRLAALDHLVLVCARYEGIDERVRRYVDLEVSIGDYVVSGGELPALVVIDAVIRLLPGAIDESSIVEESHADGLLEYPQYTRPADFRGDVVPDTLVSGDHERIRRWRLREALRRTALRRPDLLADRRLTDEERSLLDEIAAERDEPGGIA